MDTKRGLVFWVDRVSRADNHPGTVLHGLDFEGGFNSQIEIGHSFWIVSGRSKIPLKGNLQLEHSTRSGWTLYLLDGDLQSVPCLLCSEPEMRSVFHGPVDLESSDETADLSTLVGTGMPLCARDWLGIVRRSSDGFFLDAFGSSPAVTVDGSVAYSPWWSRSLEEADGLCIKVIALDTRTSPRI